MKVKGSIRGKILFLVCFVLLFHSLLSAVAFWLSLPLQLSLPVIGLISLALLLLLLKHFYGPIEEVISALETGVTSFKDRDFSIRIYKPRNDELGTIIDAYNDMATTLCDERMSLFQRELLLDTIIQSSPVSILLTDNRDFIVYANATAQTLFAQNKRLEGNQFGQLLEKLPTELADATKRMQNGLITMLQDNERHSFFLHCQTFNLNSLEHKLYLYKNLTTEISRQEIDLWKNAIRLISHELNNSLAPISSMANSAKKILAKQDKLDLLPELIDTIQMRSQRLKTFLNEYADFARLPAPKKENIEMSDFIQQLLRVCPFRLVSELPNTKMYLDPGQIEQVLLNLYKNAKESGSDAQDISLAAEVSPSHLMLVVADRGTGMTEHQLQKALLPFFSTKQKGSGLGLSLCNEIIHAHNGLIRLQNRQGGGLEIRLLLPR